MKRNLFTNEEIILCTYIARFGKIDFDENDIFNLRKRSVFSINMKIQNIAWMLSEEGYAINDNIPKLSGKTTGKTGRKTNWDIVSSLTEKDKMELLDICNKILPDKNHN